MTVAHEMVERAVLGAMIGSADLAAKCVAELEAADFFNGDNRVMFMLIKEQMQAGKGTDSVSLAGASPDNCQRIVDLLLEFYLPSQVPAYIETLKDARQRRELIEACVRISKAAEDGEDGYMEMARKAIDGVASVGGVDIAPVGDEAALAIADLADATMGMRTGFGELDVLLWGLHPGDLVVVGARPGVGKTVFALNTAVYVAQHVGPVAVFSLEMSRKQLLQRAACAIASANRSHIIKRDMSGVHRLMEAGDILSEMPLYIDDRSSLTADQIRSYCFRLKQSKGLSLVVVDYLQLMRAPSRKGGSREQEVADLSRSMKALARDMECPVLLLSQLNRDTQGVPGLRNLRESGAIEQDADIVMFLHREEDVDDEAIVSVAKHRHGKTGMVYLRWEGEYFRFRSIDWTSDAEAAEQQEIEYED